MRGPVLTVRWWRDPADRFLSRAEYSDLKRRRRFDLSEIPRGDDPELDAFVAKWRDDIGFAREWMCVPMEFERLDPDPLADVKIAMRWPPNYVPPERMPQPCMPYPEEDVEYKTIAIDCDTCKRFDCWIGYLRWEKRYGITLNADQHHLVEDK